MFEIKIVKIFLPISFNICCGCSKEPSHWDGSFEYPHHTFWLRNKKISFSIQTLNLSPGLPIWKATDCTKQHSVTTLRDPRIKERRFLHTGKSINIQLRFKHAALALAHGNASCKNNGCQYIIYRGYLLFLGKS